MRRVGGQRAAAVWCCCDLASPAGPLTCLPCHASLPLCLVMLRLAAQPSAAAAFLWACLPRVDDRRLCRAPGSHPRQRQAGGPGHGWGAVAGRIGRVQRRVRHNRQGAPRNPVQQASPPPHPHTHTPTHPHTHPTPPPSPPPPPPRSLARAAPDAGGAGLDGRAALRCARREIVPAVRTHSALVVRQSAAPWRLWRGGAAAGGRHCVARPDG